MKMLRNKNAPPTADLVQKFIDTAYDKVKLVADNLALIIVLAEAVEAGELDNFLQSTDIDTLAELNTLITDANLGDTGDFATAAQGALADTAIQGPFASAGEAIGGVDNTKAMTALRVAQAIETFADTKQNNYAGTVDPGVTNDTSEGYTVGSVWINQVTVPPESFRCADAAAGAAIWLKTTLTSDEMAAVALTGNSDDLIEGVTKLLLTVAERAKLLGIETGATADQTGAEIKAAYEAEADTNAFTDAEKTKLTGIETGATADQSNAEITNAYNAEVAIATQGEMEAGTEATVRRMTPQRVAQAIAALSGGVSYHYEEYSGVSHILALVDAEGIVGLNDAGANTITVPPNTDVAFPVNTRIDITQPGAGLTSVAAGIGVTVETNTTLNSAGQHAGMQLWQKAIDVWVLFGGAPA